MKPNILNPLWKYTSASETDLKRTFARIRKAQREKVEADAQARIEAAAKIRPMTRRAG
jgi:hypothetical protein